MKLLTCLLDGVEQVAVLAENDVVPVRELGYSFHTMNELIRGTDRQSLREMESRSHQAPASARRPLESVQLTAPIPHPVRDVVCMGLNYKPMPTKWQTP